MSRPLTQRLLAALLVLTPLALTSCDVSVNFWDQHTFTIDLTGDVTSVSNTQTVNLGDDPDVNKALDSISNLQILSLWVQVTNVYPDDTDTSQTVSGSVTITDPSDSTWAPVTIMYTNVPVSLNSQVQLTPDPSDVTAIATLLQTKHVMQMAYSGSVSSLPAHFDFQGKINIAATVDTSAL